MTDGYVTHNGNMSQDTIEDNVITQVDKEYDCVCCGKTLINASARVVLSFIITILLLIGSFIFMFTKGSVNVFVPILAGIVGFWLPSPLQSNMSRKDALTQTRMMMNNARMTKALTGKPSYLTVPAPNTLSPSQQRTDGGPSMV